MVMVGLAISMHFQQFEELKLLIFFRGIMTPNPLKTLPVSNRPDLGGIVPI